MLGALAALGQHSIGKAEKAVLPDGLELVVVCAHHIGLYGKFRRRGHKDDLHRRVVPADLPRGIDAVDAGHVYVHEHEVSRSPGVDELQRAAQDLNVELKALLGCVAPEEVLQDLRLRWRVLNYQDLEHSRPDSVRLRYRFCHRRPSRAT